MQVFISHAGAERRVAAQIAHALKSADFQVWNAEDAVLPGDNWALKTGKALEHSEVLVALFSKNAPDNSMVASEVQYALTSGNYRGRVIPVLLDFANFEAGKDVPWVLRRMDPLYLQSSSPAVGALIARVRAVAESGSNASA